MCLFVLFRLFWYVCGRDRPTERLADVEIFDHDCRIGSALSTTNTLCPLKPVKRQLNAMGSSLCCEKQHPVVDANATVVVNIFTLEVAVEDISTEGEAKGLKTAHETLLDKAGWTRPYCFGAAVQKGNFRPVSGFLNGLREGYKTVTEPGYSRPTDCLWDSRGGHNFRRIKSLQEVHEGERKQGEVSDSERSGSMSRCAWLQAESTDSKRRRSPWTSLLHADDPHVLEQFQRWHGGAQR